MPAKRVHLVVFAAAMCGAILLSGCNRQPTNTTASDFVPVGNGFGIERQSTQAYPTHKAMGMSLCYKDSAGKKIQVWPNLLMIWGNNIVIRSNTAVFVGGKADLNDDGAEELTKRLMAFRAPNGPVLDITGQVLREYCIKSGNDITNVVKDTFNSLTSTNDSIVIEFVILKRNLRGPGSIDSDDGLEIISWNKVDQIIDDVTKSGTKKKEKWSGVDYLQKE